MGTRERTVGCGLLLLVLVGSVQSGDDKDSRAAIDRAIKVEGADRRPAKNQGMTMKGTGMFYGLGEGIPFTGEWYFRGQNQSKVALEIKIGDQALKLIQVVNGAKGWTKFNTEANDMTADELREEIAENYVRYVCSLLPLKDAAFKLAPLGEVKISGKPAQGVRVSHQGQRDVNLFFDRASGFLVKNESQVKDVKGGGNKDMTQEIFFSKYQDFGGMQYPTTIAIKRDGNQFVNAEMTDIRILDSIDEAIFGRP